MFTSRAEYRLSLREDNADQRLTAIGRNLGLVDDVRWAAFNEKREAVELEKQRLRSTWVNPKVIAQAEAERVLGKGMDREYNLYDLLKRPDVDYKALTNFVKMDGTPALVEPLQSAELIQQIEIEVKYAGYVARQQAEVERGAGNESIRLPMDLDYTQVLGLSKEVQQKLNAAKPDTVGQAGRIQGVTPAAISLLLVHLKKRSLLAKAQNNSQHKAQDDSPAFADKAASA